MISRVHSFVLQGVDAAPCEVEADVAYSETRKTTIVGLPDTAVKESIDRVRTAVFNSGYIVPAGRLTINLAPAHLRKEGPVYDLPMAVALLTASRTIVPPADGEELEAESFLIAGELALDGRVRPVRGIVSLALLARELGKRGVIVSAASAAEAAVVEGIEVRGVSTLSEVVGMLNGRCVVESHPPVDIQTLIAETKPAVDFGDVRGQEAVKRAITIAAAGAHNVLMIGPAGTDQTVSGDENEDDGPTAQAGNRSRRQCGGWRRRCGAQRGWVWVESVRQSLCRICGSNCRHLQLTKTNDHERAVIGMDRVWWRDRIGRKAATDGGRTLSERSPYRSFRNLSARRRNRFPEDSA